jgi:hypothetical protein
MKARKYKQRWAKLSDAEAERARDLSKPFDESAPPIIAGDAINYLHRYNLLGTLTRDDSALPTSEREAK